MTDSELRRICQEFRKGILGNRSSEMQCAKVSYPLSGYLRFLGVENRIVEGTRGHVWIELKDGRIIDATANQFNGRWTKFHKVYIGPLPEFHRKHCL